MILRANPPRRSTIAAILLSFFLMTIAAQAQTVRINCGSWPQQLKDVAGQLWTTDRSFTGGDAMYVGTAIANTPDRLVYGTARYGLWGNFSYRIPVANGSYKLTLKFAELRHLNKGQRVFHVTVNGARVLSNFDILNEVPRFTALDKNFPVKVSDGAVLIQFQGVTSLPIVNAIEITPDPGEPVTISVSPAEASLSAAETKQFTANVGGSANTGVTWKVSGAGTISSTGVYTAPSSIAEPAAVTVTATSAADPAKTASAVVNLKTPVKVSVSPAAANLNSGLALQLDAAVTGSSDTRVVWSASAGSVSSSGLFTGPVVAAPTVVTVTAKSVADPTVSGISQVTVSPNTAPSGPPVYLENSGLVVMEAEKATLVKREHSWVPKSDLAGFSGSAYLLADPNTSVHYTRDQVQSSPEAQFKVNFKTPGTYYIWIRGYAATYADDSVNVGINGTVAPTGEALSMFPVGSRDWGWSNMQMDNVARAALVVPSAGVHTINVWMREDGFAMDKIVLSTAANYIPTNLGPAESSTDSGTPALSLSTQNLSFSAAVGATPASQTVTVTNIGCCSMPWTAVSNQSWLKVSPASGSDAGTLTISLASSALGAGNHSGTVTINAPGASGSPATINVALAVAAAAAPTLSVSPASLSFSGAAGGSNPASQPVSISSGGAWTAAKSQPWLTLSAASGTTPSSLSVGANISGLSAGTHNGTVTIAASGASGSPKTVNVTLTLASGGTSTPTNPPPTTSGKQWYVAPNGSAGGDGSISRPWDLATAFKHPAAVKPGDLIWLRGGKYGDSGTIFASHLKGTSSAPIIVRQYPGERATIDGGISIWAPYAWFWGFEITNSRPDRGTGRSAPDCVGTYTDAHYVKMINMVLHDCNQGIGMWAHSQNSEAHGNIIYYNGFQGSSRGHGHGIYTQNETGTKTLSDNIIFDQFGLGIQAYGSSNSYVRNYNVDGNIVFNNGSTASGMNKVDNILFGVGSLMQNITVQNNATYHTPTDDDGYSRLNWQFSGKAENLVARNNYWIGGEAGLEVWKWNRVDFTGNHLYGVRSRTIHLELESGQSTSGYNWNNNRYFGSGIFRFNGNKSFADWKSSTGMDSGSTFASGRPTGVWVMVRPNKYEEGRGHIAVYNWDNAGSVQVNVSSILASGSQYEIRDAQNFFGSPVASGTYNGGNISVPLTSRAKATPVGSTPNRPAHTGSEFNAFVVLKK